MAPTLGAGALADIGFTMSVFIAGEAFPNLMNYVAAKSLSFLPHLWLKGWEQVFGGEKGRNECR